jgi:hypothetical protein
MRSIHSGKDGAEDAALRNLVAWQIDSLIPAFIFLFPEAQPAKNSGQWVDECLVDLKTRTGTTADRKIRLHCA